MAIWNAGFDGGFLQSLTVTPERLQEKAVTVQKRIRQMKQDFTDLENCVNRTRGYWIGEAGDAHREFYTSKKEDIRAAFARLDEDVSDLQSMAAVYARTEQAAAALAEDLPSDAIV